MMDAKSRNNTMTGRTPYGIRVVLRLSWPYYEYFSCKLSGVGRIWPGLPTSRFGNCCNRRQPIQVDRSVVFGGGNFFDRLPRRNGSNVHFRARKRNNRFGMASIYSLGDHDPRSLWLECLGFQPQARGEAVKSIRPGQP